MYPRTYRSPNSPDLNPCDFWMWDVVEQKSNSTTPASVSDLKKSIRKAVSTIDQDETRRACSAFRRRLGRVRDVDGGHIEREGCAYMTQYAFEISTFCVFIHGINSMLKLGL